MWVIYRKSDNSVVGVSADSDVDLDKNTALQEVVRGLVDAGDPNSFDAFQVKGRDKVAKVQEKLTRLRGRNKVQPTKDGGDFDVVDDSTAAEAGAVLVTTNATQTHPVDKVPLIPGDGRSFLVVTLQKIDDQGKATNRKAKDNDVIWLRTTHGTLRADTDTDTGEIRSVTLESGTAKFRVYSENAKRLATIEMLTANPELRFGGLRVEFI